MHINLRSLSHIAFGILNDKILPALTDQQKKIIIIASVALGCLAAYFLLFRRCFKGSVEEQKKSFTEKLDIEAKIKVEEKKLDLPKIQEMKKEESESKKNGGSSPKSESHPKQKNETRKENKKDSTDGHKEKIPSPQNEKLSVDKKPKSENEKTDARPSELDKSDTKKTTLLMDEILDHAKKKGSEEDKVMKKEEEKKADSPPPKQKDKNDEIFDNNSLKTDAEKKTTVHASSPTVPKKLSLSDRASELDASWEKEYEKEIDPRADIKVRRESSPIYGNFSYADPYLTTKMREVQKEIKELFLNKVISLKDAQDICRDYKAKGMNHQKLLAITFSLLELFEKHNPQFMKCCLKLLHALHSQTPIDRQTFSDFSKKLIYNSHLTPMKTAIEQYFKDMSPEDLEDAKLIYPIGTPWRVVPFLIDPTPYSGHSNVIRIVESGTDRPIKEYVYEPDDELRKLFNSLYKGKEKLIAPKS